MTSFKHLSFTVYVPENEADTPTVYVRIPKPGKAPIHAERSLVKMTEVATHSHYLCMTAAIAAGYRKYVGSMYIPDDVPFIMYEMSANDLNLLFMDSDYHIKMIGSKYEELREESFRDWTSKQLTIAHDTSPQPDEIVEDEHDVKHPENTIPLAKKRGFARKIWRGLRGLFKLKL